MITVALPLYKMPKIAWLAFESLIRQETDAPWELLICEEHHKEQIAGRLLKEYLFKLAAAGCVHTKLIQPEQWMPLPGKWATLAKEAHADSKMFVLQAGDGYAAPDRVQRAWQSNVTWQQDSRGLFYDIHTGQTALYHSRRGMTGQNIAIATDKIRDLPMATLRRGVDNWLWKKVMNKRGFSLENRKPVEFASFETCGYHTISKARKSMLAELKWPFTATAVRVEDFAPAPVMERLAKIGGRENAKRIRATD